MTNTPNRYTLILLKDYANLSQIKVSPFTFWLLVTLCISAFLFCFMAIVVSGFIWQNSSAIKLERDALYKQFAAAQVRINRLTALEDIIYKKNVAVANVNKRSEIKEKHDALVNKNSLPAPANNEVKNPDNIQIAQNIQSKPVIEKKNETLPTNIEEKKKPSIETNKEIKNKPVQNTLVENKPKTIEKESLKEEKEAELLLKPMLSKVVALKNIKTTLQNKYITVDMDIVNTSRSKQDGTITYTILTKSKEYVVTPNNGKRNRFYSINSGKEIRTNLQLPAGVTKQMVTGLKIELKDEKVVIVRVIEKL